LLKRATKIMGGLRQRDGELEGGYKTEKVM
jgi:hypothetical protein